MHISFNYSLQFFPLWCSGIFEDFSVASFRNVNLLVGAILNNLSSSLIDIACVVESTILQIFFYLVMKIRGLKKVNSDKGLL